MDNINLGSSIKINFEKLLKLRNDIEKTFLSLTEKVDILKNIYKDIVKTHAHKEYVFGIDSLHFQNKLIETDYTNLKNIFRLIDNRVYCEYNSLYNMIKEYGSTEFLDNNIKKSVNFELKFENFKHLSDNKTYDINLVKEIHAAIFACINELDTYLTSRQYELQKDTDKLKQGLNIGNIIHSEMYRNTLMKAKLQMFYKYLEVFHTHQHKYDSRLMKKINIELELVNEDIIIKNYDNNELNLSNKKLITNKDISDNVTNLLEGIVNKGHKFN